MGNFLYKLLYFLVMTIIYCSGLGLIVELVSSFMDENPFSVAKIVERSFSKYVRIKYRIISNGNIYTVQKKIITHWQNADWFSSYSTLIEAKKQYFQCLTKEENKMEKRRNKKDQWKVVKLAEETKLGRILDE